MTPLEFETFTKTFFEKRLKNETGKNILVLHRKKLKSLTGNEYEIDLYYEFILNDAKYLTLIECKYWDSRVTRERINAFKSVIDDLKAHKGIVVTRRGFQKGAVTYAKTQGVALFKLTEEEFEPMENFDGGINDTYESIVSEPSVEYFTDNYKGFFFPSETSIWQYIIEKYGKEFALFLLEVESGNFDLDSRDCKIPQEFYPILKSMDINWDKDYRLIESAGLNFKLENEQDLRSLHLIVALLRAQIR